MKSLPLVLAAGVLLSGCGDTFSGQNGMAVDPETGRVLLSTPEGLFNVSVSPVEKVGPMFDFSGFTATAPGKYYASGHPGPGVDMPEPVGLMESADGGQSWAVLSRGGESDFHAVATSNEGFVAFDDTDETVRTSQDGETWESSRTDIQPFHLAGHPLSEVVLATTEDGLQRSTDAGSTWAGVPAAPVLMFTAFTDAQIAVGVIRDGQVHVSHDGGLTWSSAGSIQDQPTAIFATAAADGDLKVWVATRQDVQVSDDSGETFTAMDISE